MKTFKIAVLPGDGIGREVTPEAVRALRTVGLRTGVGFAVMLLAIAFVLI